MLDGIPFVRVEAVNLTGQILSLFIDFVPPRVSQVLLSVLIQSLASDKNSSDVRVAVLKALNKILSAPLTHALMKELLPELSNLIYDHSEKVRMEMVQLLETIKKIKGIKFYDIVKVEVLLSRLADDGNVKIRKCISKLLLETYFPFSGKKSTDLISRCIEAIKANSEAAKAFYESISLQVFSFVCLYFISHILDIFLPIEFSTYLSKLIC